LKVPFPLISGRDMALHAGGFLPIKTSINVVVGKPIEVQRVEHPTEEQTNQLFDAYCKELEALFSEQKAKYFENPNIELSIE
jgi:2-acylglycerol O-acyltransferase 2